MLAPRLLRTRDAASLFGVSESYLRVLRMTGKLENRMTPPPHVSVGTGRGGIRYDIRDMEKLARKNTTGQALSAACAKNFSEVEKTLPQPVFLTIAEAADYLAVSPQYLRKMRTFARVGDGVPPPPCVEAGGKTVRFELRAFDAWIDSLPRRHG